MDLRVAVIGYGLAGSVFHAPLIAATKGMRVAGIVTSNGVRQEAAREKHPDAAVLSSADDVWRRADEFDLVVVATPNRSHVPLALAAIKASLPVVVDKPLAPSSSEGRRLIEASETRNVPLTVFQNRRWDGDFCTVQALIAGGLLGPTVRFESRFERYRPAPREGAWRELADPEEAGGLLFDLGSHLIDQAVVLFGEPSTVYAELNVRRPGALVDDDTFVSLTFGDGIQAHLWMSVLTREPGPRFVVGGLRGMYTKLGLDPQEALLRDGGSPGGAGWGVESPEAWGRLSTDISGLHVEGAVETLRGQYDQFYTRLARALRDDAPLPVSPRESLRVIEIIEAAQQSAASGQTVALIR